MVQSSNPTTHQPAARAVVGVAIAAGGAFGSFYCLYSAAPLIFAGAQPSAGVRVAIVMAVVVLVQPLVLLAGRWARERARVVGVALVAMAAGFTVMPAGQAWPGLVLLGAGFGVFVVISTAWAKEMATAGGVGRALGVYGFGSAVGGTVGAPVGLLLAAWVGTPGVVAGGTGFALLGVVAVLAVARNTADRRLAALAAPARSAPQNPTAEGGRPAVPGVFVVPASLAVHLMAVTLYAAVLSSAGSLVEQTTATAAVLVALGTQSAVALGRLASGVLCDRWSAGGTTAIAGLLLAVAVAAFATTTAPVVAVTAGAAVGAAAGAIQTAALTLMMRRARTAAQTERVSAAWNIAFDLGLGAGALTATLSVLT